MTEHKICQYIDTSAKNDVNIAVVIHEMVLNIKKYSIFKSKIDKKAIEAADQSCAVM